MILLGVISQEKETKDIQIGKVEVKLFLLADGMMVCIENLMESTKKLPELRSGFSQVAGYKINIYKSTVLLYTKSKLETEMERQNHYSSIKKC